MDRFEALAQQLIEESLARLLGGQLQPRDVLQALVNAIDDADEGVAAPAQAQRVAPNHFWVTLNDADFERLRADQPGLADELAEQTRQVLLQMGFRLDMPPRVLLSGKEDVPRRGMRVTARWIPAAPNGESEDVSARRGGGASSLPRRPFLIVDGRRQIDLTMMTVVIGRSRGGHVVLDDRRVSRQHLELRWLSASERFLAVDLGSSGGTRLNGHAIKQCTLEAGDIISLGGYELIYGEEFELSSTSSFKPEHGSTSTQDV
jgi:hypothetical protein